MYRFPYTVLIHMHLRFRFIYCTFLMCGVKNHVTFMLACEEMQPECKKYIKYLQKCLTLYLF